MKKGNILKWIGLVFVVLIVLGYFFVYRPVMKIKAQASVVVASARELKSTFSKNDIELLKTKLDDFSTQYSIFEADAKSIYWASFVPYVSDFKNGVEAGNYVIDAAKQGVAAIEPYADLIGFKKGQSSFSEKSAQDRLQTAVLTLDKMLTKIDPISADIKQAEDRIAKINPNIYPEKIGNTNVRSSITTLKQEFQGVSSLFVDAKPLIKKLPDILGANGEQTYLVLFQDDKELRATGGFLTFYAVFKVKDGKLTVDSSNDIYTLDASIPSHPVAPAPILEYHKGVSQFYIRDSNLSPDFVESMKLFNTLYQKSSLKVNYDGVIAVDSKVLVDMLKIFGNVTVDGVTFSATPDSRCNNCAQVIYELFDLVDKPTPYLRENRKGILGDLLYTLFYRALQFSPSKYWGTLAQTMYQNLQDKDILLEFNDPQIEASVDKLDFGGRINSYSGDYLHINNVNFAGAKSNLFVTENIESDATSGSDGLITRTVTVKYKNPYPPSDCNLERGNLCLNAILRNWVRLYVPQGSKLISFQGSMKAVQTYDELGKTVFEGFLEVPTQGTASIIVKYTLPKSLSNQKYSLMIQKQPGIESQGLVVKYNNQVLFDGNLIQDQIFKL